MTECMTTTCDNDAEYWVHWEQHGRIRAYCSYHYDHLDGQEGIDLATISTLGAAPDE